MSQHKIAGPDKPVRPPQWPLRIFRFLAKEEYLEEIEGDMEELFRDNLLRYSVRKAKRIYSWDMLRLLRPALLKNLDRFQPTNSYGMFKNYFKIAIRGMLKHPVNSFINLFGLSIAIGICVLVFGFARWTFGTDQFHKNKNEVYLATFFAERDGTVLQYGQTPRPLGEMLQKDFAQISNTCRVEDRNAVLKYHDALFHEKLRYTDPSFLEMFSFPLKWGAAASLKDPDNIILSEKMSEKYFGKENPVGQQLLVKFDKDRSKPFNVSGVAVDFPKAHTIDFDFLINFDNLKTADPTYDQHDWKALVNATFIQVKNAADMVAIQQGMTKYIRLQKEAVHEDWAISGFTFEPLATLHEKSEHIKDGISWSSADNYAAVVFLCIIGCFMLTIACFNYINIAVVSAARRLKEIGFRKSVGASRITIIIQFLSENIILTFFALLLGLLLGTAVFIPWFEENNHFNMDFRLRDSVLWIYLTAILFLTGLASGLYPSLYISKFQVVGILKGAVKFGNKNRLTKILLGFQLILAFILITSAVLFSQNSRYMAKRSWGYQQHHALYAEVMDEAAFNKLNAMLLQNPAVLSTAGSAQHLGKSNSNTIIHLPHHPVEVGAFAVSANYFETMGLAVSSGRVFKDHFETDLKTIVVNETLVKQLAMKDPVNQIVKIGDQQYQVIGVVKDFHSYSFSEKVRPAIFTLATTASYRYLSVKVRPGDEAKLYKTLKAYWAGIYPDIPFEGGYQEDVWGNYYAEMNVHARFWKGIATIAILLTAFGLYGLMTLNVAGRRREFSIRKVLGAGATSLTNAVMKQYLLLFSISLVIGAPVSYFLMQIVFDVAYSYHIPIKYSSVALGMFILIAVLLLTVSTQIFKVIKSNPIAGLKVE